jgi:hypothetical protein
MAIPGDVLDLVLDATTIFNPITPDTKFHTASLADETRILGDGICKVLRIVGASQEIERHAGFEFDASVRDYSGPSTSAKEAFREFATNNLQEYKLKVQQSPYQSGMDTYDSTMQNVYSIVSAAQRQLDRGCITGMLYENMVRDNRDNPRVRSLTAEEEGAIVIDAYEPGVTVDILDLIEQRFMENNAGPAQIYWYTNSLSVRQWKESARESGSSSADLAFNRTKLNDTNLLMPVLMRTLESGGYGLERKEYFSLYRDNDGVPITATNGSTVIETVATIPGNCVLTYSLTERHQRAMMLEGTYVPNDPTMLRRPVTVGELVQVYEDAPNATNEAFRLWFSRMMFSTVRINPSLFALIRVQSGFDVDGNRLATSALMNGVVEHARAKVKRKMVDIADSVDIATRTAKLEELQAEADKSKTKSKGGK